MDSSHRLNLITTDCLNPVDKEVLYICTSNSDARFCALCRWCCQKHGVRKQPHHVQSYRPPTGELHLPNVWRFSPIGSYMLSNRPPISFLQEDFDVFFTPSNYEDPNIRKQIQEHHITAYENTRGRHSAKGKNKTTPVVANDPDGKTKTISTEAGLRRLGRQLQRTEQELWSDLALRALRVGKVDKALKILRFALLKVVSCL